MNPEDSHDEIGKLLRSTKPRVTPPPGLEARILHSLEPRKPKPVIRFWPWLLLPPATAAVVLMLRPTSGETKAPGARTLPTPPLLVKPGPASIRWKNPLETESLALQRDLQRAERFLVSCLPVLPAPER